MDKTKTRALTSSIVICAYNEQETIAKVLDHCLDQTRPFESIIIVDNNSKDDTAKIIQRYAKKHPQVKYLFQPKQGVMAARTMGFDAVTSDIIGKTDADTYIASDWNETMLSVFETKNQQTDAVTGLTQFFDQNKLMNRYGEATEPQKIVDKRLTFIYPYILWGYNMALTRKMWQVIRDNTCTNERFFDDIDTAHHIVEAGGVIRFEPDMRVLTSSRRYRDSLIDLHDYFSRVSDMHKAHGERLLALAHKLHVMPTIFVFRYIPINIYFTVERLRSRVKALSK